RCGVPLDDEFAIEEVLDTKENLHASEYFPADVDIHSAVVGKPKAIEIVVVLPSCDLPRSRSRQPSGIRIRQLHRSAMSGNFSKVVAGDGNSTGIRSSFLHLCNVVQVRH